MLQCRNWGRGTKNAGEWEALTQGKGHTHKGHKGHTHKGRDTLTQGTHTHTHTREGTHSHKGRDTHTHKGRETHTQGKGQTHKGERQNYMLLHTCCKLQPGFCSQSCGVEYRLF